MSNDTMRLPHDEVLKILNKLPSESACVDYKREIYRKTDSHGFIKDVISMLNSEEELGKPKIILMGVTNKEHVKCGVNIDGWKDDNEWQNLLDKISPRPKAVTGYVEHGGRYYAYIYIYGDNYEWVYEVAETVVGDKEADFKERNAVFKGQAFTRHGSVNAVLDQNGREKLVKKRVFLEQRSIESPRPEIIKTGSFVVAALLGSWNENYAGDVSVIQQLAGKSFEKYTEDIRNISNNQPDLLSYKDKVWTCTNAKTSLLSASSQIYDDMLENFFSIAEEVFLDVDPKYSLPSDQRSMASIILKDREKKYSYELLKGIANTIAILGNSYDAFPNVGQNKIKNRIRKLEIRIFSTDNWEVYATIADTFQHLGEASPGVFLKEIIRLVSDNDPAFSCYMNEKEEFLFSTEYGYQVGNAITIIAQHKEFFSLSFRTLLMLANKWERFVDYALGIVLPWFPQTNADADMRIGVVKGICADYDEVAWKLLMKLMPGATTVGSPIQRPDHLAVEPIPESISPDYQKVSIAYIDLACNMLNKDIERIISIVSVLGDVDGEEKEKIIDSIKQESVYIDQAAKEKLWNTLQDFIFRHRQFSHTKWALSEEALAPVEELAINLFPDCQEVRSRRLFREEQYNLYDFCDEGDPKNALFDHQKEIIKEKYRKGGVSAIVDFSNEAGDKRLVGSIAEEYLTEKEIRALIKECNNPQDNELLQGIIARIPFEKVMTIIEECDDNKKALIASMSGLSDEIINYVEGLNEVAKGCYWKSVNPMRLKKENIKNVRALVCSFNTAERPEAAINCLYSILLSQKEIDDPNLVIDTLRAYVAVSNQKKNDIYEIQILIKWLQNQAEKGIVIEEDIVGIEWQYLNILDLEEECEPVFLWRKLSSDGGFYMEVIDAVFNFCDTFQGNELNDTIRNHLFKMLRKWKRTPGLGEDGFIDQESLKTWLSEVDAHYSTEDQKAKAMEIFGEAAFHAPPDRDGFFIDRGIVLALMNDTTEEALGGYSMEEVNSQGVTLVDPTGESEFKIEESYRRKAEQADAEGYLSFADVLRSIADSHHEDGERNRNVAAEIKPSD